MEKKYVFISISIVFLLITTSTISAYGSEIEKNNVKIDFANKESIDIDLLKVRVQEKLNTLCEQKFTFTSLIKQHLTTKSSDDPDGPYEGGLDDSSDFSALFWGLSGFVFVYFSLSLLLNRENLLQFIGGAVGTFAASFNLVMNLGEAFDLIEYVEDGC